MGTKKRKEAVTKEVFTDKDAPEVWTKEIFNEFIETTKANYDAGDDLYKQCAWGFTGAMIDDVLSGKIVVLNSA